MVYILNKIKFNIDSATGHLSETDTKKYFSTVGFAVFALVVIQYITSIALSIIVSMFAPWMFDNVIISSILNLLPIYLVAVPVFIKMISRLPAVDPLSSPLGAKGWWGGLCCTVTMMMLGNYLSQIIIVWFETMMNKQQTNPVQTMTANTPWWVNLIFIAILAPILEEIVFRKILCRHLLPLGEGYAIVLSSVIFGLCHGNFFQFFYAFGVGLILALIYVKTGNLIHTITFHFIMNFLGGVFAPWLLSKIDLNKLAEILEQMADTAQTSDAILPYVQPLMLLALYEVFMYTAVIIGTVLLIKARKKYSLDSGILPPPKEHKVDNIFLNTGVAASLAAFAFVFIISLLL